MTDSGVIPVTFMEPVRVGSGSSSVASIPRNGETQDERDDRLAEILARGVLGVIGEKEDSTADQDCEASRT